MRNTIVLSAVLFTMFIHCASVPKNLVILNSKVATGLEELEKQNLKMLAVYHEMVVNKVNDDIEKILENSNAIFINKNGREPVSKDDYNQIAVIAMMQRDKILRIVNDSINAMEEKITENFKNVKNINNEMTMYLASLAKLKEAEDHLVEAIKSQTGFNLDFKKEFEGINSQIDSFLKGDIQK